MFEEDGGSVFPVFAHAEVEEEGVVLGCLGGVVVFDEEAVAAGVEVFEAWDGGLHEMGGGELNVAGCVDDGDVDCGG